MDKNSFIHDRPFFPPNKIFLLLAVLSLFSVPPSFAKGNSGSYQLNVLVENPQIHSGERQRIDIYISGDGEINSPKLNYYLPINLMKSGDALTREEKENTKFCFGVVGDGVNGSEFNFGTVRIKHNSGAGTTKYEDIKYSFGTGVNSTSNTISLDERLFQIINNQNRTIRSEVGIKPTAQDYDWFRKIYKKVWGLLLPASDSHPNPPILLGFYIGDKASKGTQSIKFVLTYNDGEKWTQNSVTTEFDVLHWYEPWLIPFLTVLGFILAFIGVGDKIKILYLSIKGRLCKYRLCRYLKSKTCRLCKYLKPKTNFHVRKAGESDTQAILNMVMAAFGERQGREISNLISDLTEDSSAHPLLSLVAIADDAVVGHILFTNAQIRPASQAVSSAILAPLSVHPAYQGRGIGGRLIKEGHNRLKTTGVKLVFVLGHPGYYPKYGFGPAGIKGFEAPYPIPAENAEAWMVQELQPGIIGKISGRVICAKALDDPRHWQE